MLNEIQNKVFVEKYRPQDWQSLIFGNKQLIMNHLKNPMAIPSFIFYSNHPGTGKTTTAKLIIKELDADNITINASSDRGIDTIRDQVNDFARNMSSNPNCKRCIFMDEADSLTKAAQDSLRNLMEEYSDNCFFLFSCNDVGKIIDPIQSRCVLINFEKPSKADIIQRIDFICQQEGINSNYNEVEALVNMHYPDMRSMIKALQTAKVENKPITFSQIDFNQMLQAIKTSNIEYLYNMTYSGDLDIYAFVRWLFRYFFDNMKQYDNNKLADVAIRLAEIEKGWTINANVEVIFLANMVQIAKILRS